jgi:hypothetical protein
VRAGGGRTKGIIKFCGQINQQGAVDATSHDKFEEHGELDMADIDVDLNPEESLSQVRRGESGGFRQLREVFECARERRVDEGDEDCNTNISRSGKGLRQERFHGSGSGTENNLALTRMMKNEATMRQPETKKLIIQVNTRYEYRT